MGHLTRFFVLVETRNTKASTVPAVIAEGVSYAFSPPETFHSDQGIELENELVKE